jgi:hypothetical protein
MVDPARTSNQALMTDTVFENARIHTLDPARPRAEAMLVRGERIVAVGDRDECRDRAGVGARRVDLGGMTVLPGLIDSHIHSALYVRGLEQVDLRGTTSLDEALTRITRHAATLPPDAWLFGGRWDSHKWARPVQPTRADLDRVCPDRPAVLPSIDGHTTWVNSAALRVLGIDAHTPDPVGGQIVRDEHGEPTGILREAAGDAAYDLMRSARSGTWSSSCAPTCPGCSPSASPASTTSTGRTAGPRTRPCTPGASCRCGCTSRSRRPRWTRRSTGAGRPATGTAGCVPDRSRSSPTGRSAHTPA